MQPRTTTGQWRRRYAVYFGVSVLVVALTAAAHSRRGTSFQRFLGGSNPLAVVLVVLAPGALLLYLLRTRVGFEISQSGNLNGVLLSSILSVPFAAVIILVDRMGTFSADLNVPFPESLAFYPAMGFVAGILFLIVPLSILTLTLNRTARRLGRDRMIWISIVAVSVIETAYQVRFMIGHSPGWAVACVGVHVYLLSLVQLSLFKRYDLVSMYAFRVSYYLLWHVLRGHVRLSLLF